MLFLWVIFHDIGYVLSLYSAKIVPINKFPIVHLRFFLFSLVIHNLDQE